MNKKILSISMILVLLISLIIVLFFIFINVNQNKKYQNNLLWQTGPIKQEDKREELPEKDQLSYFFGDIDFNYITYKEENNHIKFFGDEENVKKTKIYNREIKLWKNDVYEEQLILFKTNNLDEVKDIKVEVANPDTAIDVSAKIIKPIKSHNTTNASNDFILKGKFITFDEITNNFCLEKMPFSFQPILIRYESNEFAKSGNIDLNISYTINGIEKVIKINKKFSVANNLDYETSEFGSSAIFFPNSSSKFILKNLNDVVNVRKIYYSDKDNINFDNWEQLKELILKANPLLPADANIFKVEEEAGGGRLRYD